MERPTSFSTIPLRFFVNLQTGRPALDADVALHFNPRLDSQRCVVLNSRRSKEWMAEERHALLVEEGEAMVPAFRPGKEGEVIIKAEDNHYQVGTTYYRYILQPSADPVA